VFYNSLWRCRHHRPCVTPLSRSCPRSNLCYLPIVTVQGSKQTYLSSHTPVNNLPRVVIATAPEAAVKIDLERCQLNRPSLRSFKCCSCWHTDLWHWASWVLIADNSDIGNVTWPEPLGFTWFTARTRGFRENGQGKNGVGKKGHYLPQCGSKCSKCAIWLISHNADNC